MSKKIEMADEYVKMAEKDMAYAPEFHFTPPTGWMNDPNGLCQYQGTYHLFYQFNPFAPRMGRTFWGHATSTDLVHWQHEKVALKPNRKYDWVGAWSGSALVKNDRMYLFYTGNSIKQQQCLARYDFARGTAEKYAKNPIIPVDKLPVKKDKENFRDPKVIRYKDHYLMVTGGKQDGHGVIYYFQSRNLADWDYVGLFPCPEITGALECPDLFELDGRYVVIASQPNNVRYYVYDKMPIDGGIELYQDKLDFGEYFYAPQSFRAEDGRRIMLAWANAWGKPIGTASHGWAGTMTVPRELSLDESHHLVVRPCREILAYLARQAGGRDGWSGAQTGYISKMLDFSEKSEYDITVLKDKQSHAAIRFKMRHRDGVVHVFVERDGIYREACTVKGSKLSLEVLLDHYMAEVFLDDGRKAITEIHYHGGDCILYQEEAKN